MQKFTFDERRLLRVIANYVVAQLQSNIMTCDIKLEHIVTVVHTLQLTSDEKSYVIEYVLSLLR